MLNKQKKGATYRVDFKIPRLARTAEVDNDLFIGELELFESDMGTVSPRTTVVGVESYFWGDPIGAISSRGHDGWILTNVSTSKMVY